MTQQKSSGRRRGAISEPSFKVTEPAELMQFLLASMPHKNRDNIKTLLRDGQVLVDGDPVNQYNYALLPGQKVQLSRNKIAQQKTYRGISIVYEDTDVIVINKHSGTLSVATDNKEKHTAYTILYDHVKTKNPKGKIFVVHRLDRETSGLMVFAKSPKVQKELQENWNDIVRERTYFAVIEGVPEPPVGQISSYLREAGDHKVYSSLSGDDGKYATTHYQMMKSSGAYSLLKLNLRTGRKNQIRVHLQDLGHPIVGDRKYGSTVNPIGRLALHAGVLAFQHPVNRRELHFSATLPRKFSELF